EQGLEVYAETFATGHLAALSAKLGLGEPDEALNDELFRVLALVETDMTLFFRGLAALSAERAPGEQSDDELLAPLAEAYYDAAPLAPPARAATCAWLRDYLDRVRATGVPDAQRRARMNAVNP